MSQSKFLVLAGVGIVALASITGVNTMAQKDNPAVTSTGMDASHLSEKQQYVTLHDGTEPPFQNEYWDHKEPGIYVDAISGATIHVIEMFTLAEAALEGAAR